MKSSVIVCFVFEMEIVGHGVSFIIIIVIIIIIIIIAFFFISESQMDPPEPPFFSSEHGKWFAPMCNGATFPLRLTNTRVSGAWILFLLDDRKWNRSVRMYRPGSQLKIKLTFNTRKGYYTNPILLKRCDPMWLAQSINKWALSMWWVQLEAIITTKLLVRLVGKCTFDIEKSSHIMDFSQIEQ